MRHSLIERLRVRLAGTRKGSSADSSLAARTVDDNVFFGNNVSGFYRDRVDYSREKVLAETLRAWRVNPVARSIVRTITAFVVGKGIAISSEHEATDAFLREWWTHPLNRMDRQLKRWMDELTRSGNLFLLYTVEAHSGMTFVRAVPAETIREIQTAGNDIEQERYYVRKELGESPWEAYEAGTEQNEFMLHYSVNRPVGTNWGEPDLAPMLPWIGRLSTMLEDRARLQRYRNAFVYVITGRFVSEAERKQRQAEIAANPPQPGSVLVVNEGEAWSAIAPNLASGDAEKDILAVKKFIASGVNFPMHWLAEPESSTRTTAEAAGTPTFRNLEEIQTEFLIMLKEMARVAVEVRKRIDGRVNVEAEIVVSGPDITERDNSLLALAVGRIYPAIVDLYDRRLMDEKELLRLVYRMAAENFDPQDVPGEGIRRQPEPIKSKAGEPDPDEKGIVEE